MGIASVRACAKYICASKYSRMIVDEERSFNENRAFPNRAISRWPTSLEDETRQLEALVQWLKSPATS
jgi:hypothetical protein